MLLSATWAKWTVKVTPPATCLLPCLTTWVSLGTTYQSLPWRLSCKAQFSFQRTGPPRNRPRNQRSYWLSTECLHQELCSWVVNTKYTQKGLFHRRDAEVWNNFLLILSCPSPFIFVQVLRQGCAQAGHFKTCYVARMRSISGLSASTYRGLTSRTTLHSTAQLMWCWGLNSASC